MTKDFFDKIKQFNDMYKVDSNDNPKHLGKERIENFKKIISEEIEEADEIINNYSGSPEDLTSLADWLGDIIVYCSSEARRWGIDMNEVLKIIMDSNFSKLGPDGKPIYDERGKIMKGPNYWKPEPKLREMIETKLREQQNP